MTYLVIWNILTNLRFLIKTSENYTTGHGPRSDIAGASCRLLPVLQPFLVLSWTKYQACFRYLWSDHQVTEHVSIYLSWP